MSQESKTQHSRRNRSSDLPFGSEFSPSQISLPSVLEFAENSCGDWRAFERKIRATYFQVLDRIEDQGYIVRVRGTRKSGRGAKPDRIKATKKLNSYLLVPLLEQFEQQTNADLRPFLRLPLSSISKQMKDPDKQVRGLALEAFALRLMRLIDLNYVGTRVRGSATGGAEVDVIFESSRLVFSRWQVQCKNTKSVSLDDVAKEVGLTHFLKSNAIVIVTTGLVGPQARAYAHKIMADSNICIIMVDGNDVSAIVKNPTRIVDVFNREAENAMKLKALNL